MMVSKGGPDLESMQEWEGIDVQRSQKNKKEQYNGFFI